MSYYNSFAGHLSGAGCPAEAVAFLTATGITDATITAAICTLVSDLKENGLWTKLSAIYPMVGGTATTHKYNLKDPRDLDAAYRLTFSGGWTHDANGAKPNGTNGYANTHLNPSSVFNTTTFCSMGYYSKTNSAVSTEYVMGCVVTGAGSMLLMARRNTNQRFFAATFPSGISFQGANDTNSLDGRGLFLGTQQGANIRLLKNEVVVVSNTNAATGLPIPNLNLVLGGLNLDGTVGFWTDKLCAFAPIGEGLSNAEAELESDIINEFETALGRNEY